MVNSYYCNTMSKLARIGKTVRKATEAVKLPNIIDTVIQSGCASTGPPLGPILGQRGIPIAKFAQHFNELTKDMIPGIPIDTRIYIDGKKYKIDVFSPTSEYLIRQAAGLKKMERPYEQGEEFLGKIKYKHLYEIASVKIQDEYFTIRDYTMKQMCEEIANVCWNIGVDVVRDLDPVEYDAFLTQVEGREAEFQEEKAQKELELKKKMKLQ